MNVEVTGDDKFMGSGSRSFTVGIRNNLRTNILKHFSSHTAMLPTYRVKLGTSKITDIK